MACSGAYAAAWQFVQFWCVEGTVVRTGVDDSGGAANPALSDSHANFVNSGFSANTGMELWNLTEGTYGLITAVTATTLTGTGVTWTDGDSYRAAAIEWKERTTIEGVLEQTASDIHAARGSVGGCDCTLASWATDYLAHLNSMLAGAVYTCKCADPALTDATKDRIMTWAGNQIDKIRDGRIELCQGHTGSESPSMDFFSIPATPAAGAKIIENYFRRNWS